MAKRATEAETERFFDLLQLEGLTVGRAAAMLAAEGYRDRGVAFWRAEHRRFMKAIAELEVLEADCIGFDGALYGHR